MPELAVIVVNWRVRELLRACLGSLLAHTRLPPGALEIVVVDNASADGSVEMLAREFPAVRVLANCTNAGFAAANNQAFALTRAPFVLLLNPDTLLVDDAAGRMLARMRALPAVGALGCRLLNGDGSLQRWTAGAFPRLANVARHYLFFDRVFPGVLRSPLYLDRDVAHEIDVGWVSGACMLLRREALGPRIFDESYFMYGEDLDLCHRLSATGWRVRYTPLASVIHFQGASMKQQRGEVLLASLKGPRQFLSRTRPKHELALFDALTVCGFFLRWLAYAAATRLGGAYAQRCASSRDYLTLALRVRRGQ